MLEEAEVNKEDDCERIEGNEASYDRDSLEFVREGDLEQPSEYPPEINEQPPAPDEQPRDTSANAFVNHEPLARYGRWAISFPPIIRGPVLRGGGAFLKLSTV